jgi:ubiquinone/menaquinone biosynthesis C-methylase UbiE/uncharacterized protein YbaR (Trm112 family)
LTAHVFAEGTAGHIQDGVLTCEGCQAWYPIEGDLLELVESSLLDPRDHVRFCARFKRQIEDLKLSSNQDKGTTEPSASDEDLSAQLKQRQLFDWYAENSQQTYDDFQNTPFWVAADTVTFARWKSWIKPDSLLLDVGCANGRSAFPFVNGAGIVIGLDISKKMVRQAIDRARSLGVHGETTFFVADGNNLPFRDQSFDYVLTYGVLNHLPDPGRTCRDVQRILKKGGIYFGSENNKSMFREIFDLLMKMKPLWTKEAGAEPLISASMLQEWNKGLAVQITCSASVFLPPHLFNLVGKKIARPLLAATDRLFSTVPGFRSEGGLIVFEIQKL